MIVFSGIRGGAFASEVGQSDCGTISDRAGLARLWALPCAVVNGLIFDANRKVSGVSLRCDAPTIDWVEITFDTGQFQQSQQSLNRYNQTVSVGLNGQSEFNRNQINHLSSCSCWHFVALDEADNYHYIGAHTYDRGSITRWESAGLRASGNNTNTGSEPESTNNNLQLVFSAFGVHQLAPRTIGSPTDLAATCGIGVKPASSTGGGNLPTVGEEVDPGGEPGGGTNPGETGDPNNWQSDDGSEWTSDDGSIWYS